MAFRFLDPGPLIDRELELVAPSERWIDATLQTCSHPACAGDDRCNLTTRGSLMDFLQIDVASGALDLWTVDLANYRRELWLNRMCDPQSRQQRRNGPAQDRPVGGFERLATGVTP